MNDLKKKCWREKVTAEITLAHLQQFAAESGDKMSAAEVAAFLNQDGRAHRLWLHMMQAGEDYMKQALGQRVTGFQPIQPATTHAEFVN